MEAFRRGSLKLDIASAYLLTVARIGAWLVISSYVYQGTYKGALSTLALVRSTLGLLTYIGLGLGPALVHHLAAAMHNPAPAIPAIPMAARTDSRLEYASPRSSRRVPTISERYYFNGLLVSILTCVFAFVALAAVNASFDWGSHSTVQPGRAESFALIFGGGIILRLFSESSGAMLQASGKLALDNCLQCIAEGAWAWLAIHNVGEFALASVGNAFVFSAMLLIVMRIVAAQIYLGPAVINFHLTDWSIVKRLVTFGSLLTIAQLADFLYAPTDNILITALLGPDRVATYVPAIQVDAALLLTVTAAATALFPRAAIEHASGNLSVVRNYYFRGTLASIVLLLIGAFAAYVAAPILFRLWLHDPMPATQAILPLVLIHTVVGGSSAVGRSILLAIGKVRAFTIAVLIAGVTNVILSYVFVRYFHLGLRGIILGTIVAVVGRCAIWMPWYTLRALRRADIDPSAGVEVQRLPEIA